MCCRSMVVYASECFFFDTAALKIAMRKLKLGVGVTGLCGSPPPSNSFAMIL
jgi:hypothetical protein